MQTTTMKILLTTIVVACGANPQDATTPNEQLGTRRADLLRYLDASDAVQQTVVSRCGPDFAMSTRIRAALRTTATSRRTSGTTR